MRIDLHLYKAKEVLFANKTSYCFNKTSKVQFFDRDVLSWNSKLDLISFKHVAGKYLTFEIWMNIYSKIPNFKNIAFVEAIYKKSNFNGYTTNFAKEKE